MSRQLEQGSERRIERYCEVLIKITEPNFFSSISFSTNILISASLSAIISLDSMVVSASLFIEVTFSFSFLIALFLE